MRKLRNGVAVMAVVVQMCGALLPDAALAGDASVKLGLAVAQSGFMQAYDGDATSTVMLWIDDQNQHGGLLGKPVESVVVDTQSDRAQGARAGREIVEGGAAIAIVSCDYDYGVSAAAAAESAKVISVFLCAEDPKAGIQGVGKYAFTASVAAQLQGASMATWGYEKLHVKKVYALLDPTIEYSKSVCSGWDWAVKKAGLKVLGADTFKNDDPSIQAQINRIKSLPEQPDAIMMCSYIPGAASALRQLRAAGINAPIFAGSAVDGIYWTDAVADLGNFYIPVQASVYGDDPRPAVNAFVKRFNAKFGHDPATTYAAPIYAFLSLWSEAVQKAGSTDADKVLPILESFTNRETMIGPKTFSSAYHIQLDSEMQILRYDAGKPKVVDSFRVSEPVPEAVLFRRN